MPNAIEYIKYKLVLFPFAKKKKTLQNSYHYQFQIGILPVNHPHYKDLCYKASLCMVHQIDSLGKCPLIFYCLKLGFIAHFRYLLQPKELLKKTINNRISLS